MERVFFSATVFLWLPLLILAAFCVLCLVNLPENRRRGLLPAALAMTVCAAVLLGGAWLLGRFGLTWRMIPKVSAGLLLWAMGLTSGVLTVRFTGRWLTERRPKLAVYGQALALYCLISVMGAGSVLGGLWAFGVTEEVGTWRGERVVQGHNFLTYEVYEYYGPLIRGVDALGWSEDPMIEESREQAWERGMASAEEEMEISLCGGMPLYYEDTHGGFLGDGETFLTVSFEEPPDWLPGWTPLPLAENLDLAGRSLAGGYFPDVRQGRYFFRDWQAKEGENADGSALFSRGSWNFTLAVYDSEAGILYYYKLDT